MKNSVVEDYRKRLVGQEFETINYGKCVIVEYESSRRITVKFYEPECLVTCEMGRLRRGKVANPMFPTFYKKGCIGVWKYNYRNDKRVYVLWTSMLTRAYCPIYKSRQSTYKDVEVCNEWLNFQNFASWFYSEEFADVVDNNQQVYQLDKDILVKGNKVYSPETCCFVPREVNSLLLSNNSRRGKYPIGVSRYRKKFKACVSIGSNRNHNLGIYNSPQDAFQAYKKAKEAYIKEVAERYKSVISNKLYEALYRYEIETTD